jgi:2-(3-amino-3-carboxypropyl)histidine synthase
MSEGEAFDFQLDYIISVIKDTGAKVVGLQFPEGFKRRSPAIASGLEEETGARILISGNPCFGACDIDVALTEDVDIMFHFGHAPLDDNAVSRKVYFIETRSAVEVRDVVKMAVSELTGQRIGIISTVQHVHKLDDAASVLKKHGKECVICGGDGKIAYPGQVLGCNFSAARNEECDEYLYIGSGQFHPLGVSLATKKRVLIADPFVNELREADSSKVLRQRSAVIAKSLDADVFGIVVSCKPGQKRMELAVKLKKMAKEHDKEAHILTMDLVTPDQLLQFKVDAFVNTACPRLAVDEVGRFHAPMLTPMEFEIVLGQRQWEELVFDEITGE